MYEIERKFLIGKIPESVDFVETDIIEQYFLSTNSEMIVRTRRYGEKYFITFKKGSLLKRLEKEIEVQKQDFEDLKLFNDKNAIIKERKICYHNNFKIEIDFFMGQLSGLVVAEVEFKSESEAIEYIPPQWFGKEVTQDYRYTNSSLSELQKIPE